MRRYAEYALLGLVFVIWIAQGFLPDRGVGIVTGVVIYLISWWMLFLGSLPLKVRGQFEDGEIPEGTEEGAPAEPMLAKKAIWATIGAVVCTAIAGIIVVPLLRYYGA